MVRVCPFPEGRSGILVVRAWLEGRPPEMRLRITSVADLAGPELEVAYAATVGDAIDVITRWLAAFEAGDAAVTDE
jgi:hypothetical protein